MKKIIFFLAIVFISQVSFAQSTKQSYKRYGVKSGIIEYKTTVSGKVLVSKVEGGGTSSIYFKDYGAVELQKEKSSQKNITKFFGTTKIDSSKVNIISKFDHGKVTSVDLDKKTKYAGQDVGIGLFSKNKDPYKAGEEMLEDIGGEKIGTEDFLGYKCDVWKVPGGKEYLYKGAVLKLDMNVLGVRTVKTATSAKFDISIPDKDFELPKY